MTIESTKTQNIFYKLLKKPKIKEKLDKTYLPSQTENLFNIKQTLTKKKFSMRTLEVQKSPEKISISPKIQYRNTEPTYKKPNDTFLTNLTRIQKRYTKRTTIGRSTIISHSNIRYSEIFQNMKNFGDRQKIIKLANEMTIKSNNNIKVSCFNSKTNNKFTFSHESCDYRRSSCNSMYKRLTIEKDYKRVQKLENNIKHCISNALLPKIK
jgi:hypothetical protein